MLTDHRPVASIRVCPTACSIRGRLAVQHACSFAGTTAKAHIEPYENDYYTPVVVMFPFEFSGDYLKSNVLTDTLRSSMHDTHPGACHATEIIKCQASRIVHVRLEFVPVLATSAFHRSWLAPPSGQILSTTSAQRGSPRPHNAACHTLTAEGLCSTLGAIHASCSTCTTRIGCFSGMHCPSACHSKCTKSAVKGPGCGSCNLAGAQSQLELGRAVHQAGTRHQWPPLQPAVLSLDAKPSYQQHRIAPPLSCCEFLMASGRSPPVQDAVDQSTFQQHHCLQKRCPCLSPQSAYQQH
jgi:hypothetical protein